MVRALLPPLACLLICAPCLLPQARPTDAKTRIRTIRDLEKNGGSTAIPELRGYLKDSEIEVRVEAIKAIVNIGTQHSLDPLVEAMADNDAEMQARATDGVVNFYYPGYVRTGLTASLRRVGTGIRGRFTDTNDQVIDPYVQVRADITTAVGNLARGGTSLEVRANAARAAGVLRAKAAVPDLVEALRTKDSTVIYEVLIALRKINDPSAAPMISFLLRDMDEKVQVAALETTGLLLNKNALPELRQALGRARNNNIRTAALTAIAMLPEESNRPLHEQYFKDKDEDLRAAAAEGLARLKNPADLPKLEAAFAEEKKMDPRLSIAFALVMLGKRDMTEFGALRYLVNTLNSVLYKGIAEAFLIELAREAALRQVLYPTLNERSKEEKIKLAGIFARSGDADAVPVLEALSRDGDLAVAQEGSRALRILRSRLR